MFHAIVTGKHHTDVFCIKCDLSIENATELAPFDRLTVRGGVAPSFVRGSDTTTVISRSDSTARQPVKHASCEEIFCSYYDNDTRMYGLGNSMIYERSDDVVDGFRTVVHNQDHDFLASIIIKPWIKQSLVDYYGNFLYYVSDKISGNVWDTRVRLISINGLKQDPLVSVAIGDAVYMRSHLEDGFRSIVHDHRDGSHTTIEWPVVSDFDIFTRYHRRIYAKFVDERNIQTTSCESEGCSLSVKALFYDVRNMSRPCSIVPDKRHVLSLVGNRIESILSGE